jgi:hypothetical protein
MGSRWIVKRGDQERGPFTSPQLKSLADSGQLRRTDLVTKQGENRYVPAEKVKGLFAPKDSTLPKEAPPKPKAAAQSKVPAKPEDDEEGLDFGVVEIIEEDDDPVIVLDDSRDDFEERTGKADFAKSDPVIVLDDSQEDFDAVVFEDRSDDDEDYEEPRPARSKRSASSRREAPPSRGQRGSSRRREAAPAKPKNSIKKRDDDEEEEYGPGMNLLSAFALILVAVALYIGMSKQDPNTWESRKGALFLAVLRFIYNIGGKWLVVGLILLCSGLLFWKAIKQFQEA